MKLARTVALSRHRAPPFVLVGGLELLQLRKLDDLAFRLFVELRALADFATGYVETTYVALVALLDFDHAPQAHIKPRPTTKRVRTALQALVELQLVDCDRRRNMTEEGLFLKVASTVSIGAPDDMKGRVKGRVRKPAKRATARAAAKRPPDEGQGEGQGIQYLIPPSLSPSLSTSEARPAREIVAELRARIGRGGPLK